MVPEFGKVWFHNESITKIFSHAEMSDKYRIIYDNHNPDYGDAVAVDVAENTVAVGTYTATDGDVGADLTYSITGGNDQALFSIDEDTGALVFDTAPNYDDDPCSANDGGTDTCVVVLTVNDGANTDTKTITVTVTDANDQTPTYTAGNLNPTITEGDTPAVDSDVAITDTDTGDVNVCTLGGADNGLFRDRAVLSLTGEMLAENVSCEPRS